MFILKNVEPILLQKVLRNKPKRDLPITFSCHKDFEACLGKKQTGKRSFLKAHLQGLRVYEIPLKMTLEGRGINTKIPADLEEGKESQYGAGRATQNTVLPFLPDSLSRNSHKSLTGSTQVPSFSKEN